MPKRQRSLVDQEIAARKPRDDYDPDAKYGIYETGVGFRTAKLRPCILDCERLTPNEDGICDAHDLDPGGPLWGRALTAEQVREEMTRVRWNVR